MILAIVDTWGDCRVKWRNPAFLKTLKKTYLCGHFLAKRKTTPSIRIVFPRFALFLAFASILLLPAAAIATQTDITGPAGSGEFGSRVAVLPNGNIVVTDPFYDAPGPVADVGAVYLYSPTGTLISTLTGSTADDRVGSGPIVVLGSGNFIVFSSNWDGAAADAGAVTLVNGSTGLSGTVTSSNSLVGTSTNDMPSSYTEVRALPGGNYLVIMPYWNNGPATDAGAVAWGNGATGVIGTVSAANALVGASANDNVGGAYGAQVYTLKSGNYVVLSPLWDNGSGTDAGAVTWGSGATGVSGAITPSNSLVGTSTNDKIGGDTTLPGGFPVGGFVELTNGNFVVRSPLWNNGALNDAGAATWGSGTAGIVGEISAANSLVGVASVTRVGSRGVTALKNGNYVVVTSNGIGVSAVTWGNGSTGTVGPVNGANSLMDVFQTWHTGYGGVVPLQNGHYVVLSPNWGNGTTSEAGAVTWCNGETGTAGVISAANSLVGTSQDDNVGSGGVIALANGNYVVRSPDWDEQPFLPDSGAVTWGSGTSGVSGAVTRFNSLVGTTGTTTGSILRGSVVALANGNYVVRSPNFSGFTGAATWCNGITGSTGRVSAANSLVGSAAGDLIGSGGVVALANGNFVVLSPSWKNGSTMDAGAVTWCQGTAATGSTVSSGNSLVGSTTGDKVGGSDVDIPTAGSPTATGPKTLVLGNGNYVICHPNWDNGSAIDAGAVSSINGQTGLSGPVSAANSLVGTQAGDGRTATGQYDDYTVYVTALSNGNFIVRNPCWDNGSATDAGAVTLASGTAGVSGVFSSANSLVGTSTNDRLGGIGGNLIVSNGTTASLAAVTIFSNGPYLVYSRFDNSGTFENAMTFGSGSAGVTGVIGSGNSVTGAVATTIGDQAALSHNAALQQFAVGFRGSARVSIVTYDVPVPDITVEEPVGSVLADGSSMVNFGNIAATASVTRTFTIRNDGDNPLTGLLVTKDGLSSSDFAIAQPGGTTLNSGQSTTFDVTFSPRAPGARQAMLHIASNDGDENAFDIALSGTATGAPPSGTVSLNLAAGSTIQVAESVGVVLIPLIRTGGLYGSVTVNFTTANGTATTPSDFTALTNVPVVFGDGVAVLNVPITILDPANTNEANEIFTVTISGASVNPGGPTTATVRIIDSVDSTVPTAPTITSPAAAVLVGVNTGAALSISGTSADNKGVSSVKVKLNSGDFVDVVLSAPGASSTNWSVAVAPVTGTNTLTVQSFDTRGNASALVTRMFKVTRSLVVNVNTALGSVTAGFSPGSFREVGQKFLITAAPKAATTTPAFDGAIFSEWILGGVDVANGNIVFTSQRIGVAASALEKPTLNFTFREGLTLTASFVPNPFKLLGSNSAGTSGVEYNGLIHADPMLPNPSGTSRNNSTEGLLTATVTSTGAFSGKLTIDGSVLNMAGAFDYMGVARFGTSRATTLAVARLNQPSLVVALSIDLSPGRMKDTISGTVTATSFQRSVILAVSNVTADRTFYDGLSGPTTVPDPFLTVTGVAASPVGRTDGKFTVIFPARDVVDQPAGLTTQDYPQGTGYGFLSISKTGMVTLTSGKLADGTVVSGSSKLSKENKFPLFLQLYNKKGYLSGDVQLDSAEPESDLAAVNLDWLRPFDSTAHYYPYGWPDTVRVGFQGARYAASFSPASSSLRIADGADSDLIGDALLPADLINGNAALGYFDGQLTEDLNRLVSISTTNIVTKVPASDTSFGLTLTAGTGLFTGTFVHENDQGVTVPLTTPYEGVIYQKGTGAGGYGFFLTRKPTPIDYTGESGGVSLIGQP